MSWFRLDDKFHSHQKVIGAGNAAVGLFVRCGTWSADQCTEGRIPRHVAGMFGSKAEIKRVTDAGLWTETADGYVIPDYLDYNLSNEEVEERRRKRAEAGAKGGIESGKSRRSKAEANASDNGKQIEANTNPDPTRPDPTPSAGVSEQLDDLDSRLSLSADLYAQAVYDSDPSACRTRPERYMAGIAKNARTEHIDAVEQYLRRHPNASALELAQKVMGAPKAPKGTKSAPIWFLDPGCIEHGSDGLVSMPDGGAGSPVPCPCRRSEPYPDPTPEATVIAFKPRTEESA